MTHSLYLTLCYLFISAEHIKAVKVELKGPDNTLRVRQMKILGIPAEVEGDQLVERSSATTTLVAQRKCENETLRIFRLLSSEVFGKFLYGVKRGDNDAEGNDLQEHVVGILFSRNKLTHLQKQVIKLACFLQQLALLNY